MTLYAKIAQWHGERGMALFRQHHYQKNHDKQQQMLSDYAHHMRVFDDMNRKDWMERHRKRRS